MATRKIRATSPGPVSYTHLDVYKRQLHGPFAVKVNGETVAEDLTVMPLTRVERRIRVSVTDGDVYKRQQRSCRLPKRNISPISDPNLPEGEPPLPAGTQEEILKG